MEEDLDSRKWAVSESDLKDLTPVKARDLMVECFYHAQKETYARIKQDANVLPTDENIRASVLASIKLAFKMNDVSFNEPTVRGIRVVAEMLAEKSASWGTPKDIIDHHLRLFERIILRMSKAADPARRFES